MKIRYKNVTINFNFYNPTQNSIVFHVLYSKSKTDKYKASKLQSTLSSLTRHSRDNGKGYMADAALNRVFTCFGR